jgi:hypothetical protein
MYKISHQTFSPITIILQTEGVDVHQPESKLTEVTVDILTIKCPLQEWGCTVHRFFSSCFSNGRAGFITILLLGTPYLVRNECLLHKFIFSIHQVRVSEYPVGKECSEKMTLQKNIFSMNLAAESI